MVLLTHSADGETGERWVRVPPELSADFGAGPSLNGPSIRLLTSRLYLSASLVMRTDAVLSFFSMKRFDAGKGRLIQPCTHLPVEGSNGQEASRIGNANISERPLLRSPAAGSTASCGHSPSAAIC